MHISGYLFISIFLSAFESFKFKDDESVCHKIVLLTKGEGGGVQKPPKLAEKYVNTL